MADITITVADAVLTRVLNAIAARHGYNPATDGTKGQFAKATLVKWAKKEVVEYEATQALNAQTTTSQSEIIIT